MFKNLLFSEVQNDFRHYFDPSDFRGQLLIATLVVLGALLIANVVIMLAKPQWKKKSLMVSLGVMVAYALVVIILSLIKNGEGIDFTGADGSNPTALYVSWGLIGGAIVVVLAAYFIVTGIKKGAGRNETLALAYAAICIALSFALSYVRIIKMPQGGSVTLASLLPIALYAYMFGTGRGLIVGFIYGLLQSVQDPWIIHPLQYILDYPLAFMFIGLAGAFKNIKFTSKKKSALSDGSVVAGQSAKRLHPAVALALGLFAGVMGRYLCHAVSGAVFFAEYGQSYGIFNGWAWGFGYNAVVWVDYAISAAAAVLMMLSKTMRSQVNRVENKFLGLA